MGFWTGLTTGITSLLFLAHIVSAAKEEQCEIDHQVKQCELQMVPITQSKSGES